MGQKYQVQLDYWSVALIILAISLYLFLGLDSEYQGTANYILGLALAGLVLMMVTGSLKVEGTLSGSEKSQTVRDFTLAFLAIFLTNGVVAALPVNLSVAGSPALILGVLIGVAEEIWFRGLLAPLLANRLGFIPGLASQGFLFMVYHSFVYGNNPSALAIVLISGMILGYVDLKAKRLLPSMGAHVLINALAFGVL